jgi:hypothetical protein
MEERFNKLIEQMRNQKMTDSERSALWFKIETFAQNNPVGSFSQKSPYFSRNHFFTAGKILVTSFLLMAVGFGGLSYSSASALPGEMLYTLKINVREKIEEKLVFSQEKKIDLRKKRIETRYTEVESLIKENKVTKENREIVEKNIKTEKEKIDQDLAAIEIKNPEMAIQAKETIDQSIKEHQEKIVNLIKEKEELNNQIQNQENTENISQNNTINTNEQLSSEKTEVLDSNKEQNQIQITESQQTQTQEQAQIIPVLSENKDAQLTQEVNQIKTETQLATEEKLLINSLEIITLGDASTVSSNKIDSDSSN